MEQRITRAKARIGKAMLQSQPGPYQIQAAIAALHARAERPEDTDWTGIDELYEALEHHTPSPVVTLNRSVAIWKLHGAEAALAMIAPPSEPLDGYFYFHGMRGNLLERLGRNSEARDAFGRAIALTNTPAEAAHIRQHLDRFEGECEKSRS